MHPVTEWLSSPEVAALAGISAQKTRERLARAFQSDRPWRGAALTVRQVPAPGGKVYQVALSSLPQELQDRYHHRTAAPAPVLVSRHGADDMAPFRADMISAVLRQMLQGEPQAAAVAAVCAVARYPTGRRRGQPVAVKTLSNWLRAYRRKGLAAAKRKHRSDAGVRAVTVSRAWDALVPDPVLRQTIAHKLTRRINGLWQAGVPSAPEVQRKVRPALIRWTREAMPDLGIAELQEPCTVPLEYIARDRIRHQNVAIYRLDAARFAAKIAPRIRRDRSALQPMEWVAADVNHSDIYVERDDGKLCTPKVVAWQDLATNRVFATPFLMEEGQMISRREVIQSYVELCADPDWGVPTNIYGDRGKEYNWLDLTDDLTKLKVRTQVHDRAAIDATPHGVHRSRPYNPQSKVIEGFFSTLTRAILPQLPGYIGGDRMRKKTQNQGKPPAPYPGGFDAFKPAFALALADYNTKPQRGSELLAGAAPLDRFRAFVDAGWQSITLNPANLAIVLHDKHTRVIHAGGAFKWDNGWCIGGVPGGENPLATYVGAKLTIGEPLIGDRRVLIVFDPQGEPLCLARPERLVPWGDRDGAKEQGRRATDQRRQLRALESDADDCDPLDAMRAAVEGYGPIPHAATNVEPITINARYDALAREYAALPPEADAPDDYEALMERNSALLAQIQARSDAA